MIELLRRLWSEDKITDEVYGQILDEIITQTESEMERCSFTRKKDEQ